MVFVEQYLKNVLYHHIVYYFLSYEPVDNDN